MNSFLIIAFAVLFVAPPWVLHAQVPQLISYQGRVGVDGVNFDGSGQFKFAFVNAAGTTTYWSNDGSSTAGSEPGTAINIPVSKGLYAVLLGDATLAHMSIVPATVFTHGDVHLRVWFSDGVNGFQQLTPDRRIAAVGYAMMADSVSDGAITTAKLADGAVTAAKLGSGAVVTNLSASGFSAVPSGAFVLATRDDPAITNAGYIQTESAVNTAMWEQRVVASPPSERASHTAIWTGSEMIVWGGDNSSGRLGNGARYNPALATWSAIRTEGAPGARSGHTALWTGLEMIIWGGASNFGGSFYSDGRKYDPTNDSWAAINSVNSPSGRFGHSAVWTGSEMIVWGGGGASGSRTNDGRRYSPSTDSWATVSTTGAPSPRMNHSAIWTGSEMIIWGGAGGIGYSNSGARYSPTTDSWTPLPGSGAPSARTNHTAIWTGLEMIVWGGVDGGGVSLANGGRYNPTTDSWTAISLAASQASSLHTAVWTGSEMIIWGGDAGSFLKRGMSFRPSSSKWTAMVDAELAPRILHSAVWTGNEMVIWGGSASGGSMYLNDLWSYSPGRILYMYQRP